MDGPVPVGGIRAAARAVSNANTAYTILTQRSAFGRFLLRLAVSVEHENGGYLRFTTGFKMVVVLALC